MLSDIHVDSLSKNPTNSGLRFMLDIATGLAGPDDMMSAEVARPLKTMKQGTHAIPALSPAS